MNNISTYQWSNKQILVVEDDESSAFLLGEILRETGATVNYRTDGEAAVAFMRRHPETDLILMDVLLPEMDGFTATREIKSFASKVKVIAQTAYAFSVDHHQARNAGCDAFLTKPLVSTVLLDKMDSFLS
jgi:CheY-like chemotaxis protein